MLMQTRKKIELNHKNFLKILATRINLANTGDLDEFIYFTQSNVEKSKTLTYAMESLNAAI